MPRVSKLLNSEVLNTAQKELKKLGSYGYVSKKLQAVIAASKHGIEAVAKIYGISRNTLSGWIKHVSELNLEKLEAPKDRRKPPKLNEEQMTKVRSWISANPNITSKAVMLKIQETYGINVSITTAYRIIKRLDYAYITPRPRHYKQDREKVEEFKKKPHRDYIKK